jgi:hypothetical protein
VGSLKTSDQGDAVAGEGDKDPRADEHAVDTGAKIIVNAGSTPPVVPPRIPLPRQSAHLPAAPQRGGLAMVLIAYLLAGAALAYAIYERFVV